MSKKIFRIAIILLIVTVLAGSLYFSMDVGARTTFSRTNIPEQLKVTASALNIRSGPGAYFTKVGVVYKNQIVHCIGKLGGWYVVHLNNDTIGVASSSYLTPYYPPQSSPQPTPQPQTTPKISPTPGQSTSQSVQEAQKMLELINSERAKAGVQSLRMDSDVMKVAQIKSQDMVDKNYFSHTSPTYGSPFDMLKSFNVSYKSAGENLAGNSTVEKAHTALMNSEGHRKNILNGSYNNIGIGIADSPRYGKIYVQMFIGR